MADTLRLGRSAQKAWEFKSLQAHHMLCRCSRMVRQHISNVKIGSSILSSGTIILIDRAK